MEVVRNDILMPSGKSTVRIPSDAPAGHLESAPSGAMSPAAEHLLAGDVKGYALFLDCDGTLLDIAPTPGEVRVPPGLIALLEQIAVGIDGALAILTGRQLAEIDALLRPAKFIGSGVHGAELRPSRNGPIEQVTNALPASLVEQVVLRTQKLPGIIAEPKGPGLAVHYRLAQHLEQPLEAELRALVAHYHDSLVLCHGRKLFEIIPAGHSKGTALETILAFPAFAGRRPIMIGDDIGDEPALTAARRLGGAGLRVAGEQFGCDNVDFHGPEQVLVWLKRLASRLSE